MRWVLQSRDARLPAAALGVLVLLVVGEILADSEPRGDHRAVRDSALLAVIFWADATFAMIRGWPARWAWLAAWLASLVHVAASFHLVHAWSHEAAFRHTAAVAGFGEGLYVNYLFLAAWGADAIWWAASPRTHATRPRWVGWAVHGFLGFVVFNATVVFGATAARVVGVLAFLALAAALVIPSGSRAPGPRRALS